MACKVLVGMSGGVDSTLTALLLQKEGYEVEGVYMKLHENDAYHRSNWQKVQKAASLLGIKVHFLDLSKRFKEEVYDYFVASYQAGQTPNPCVMCNRSVKFGEMIAFADRLGIEKVATGHYIRCDGAFFYTAKDDNKDQSYFLCEVKKEVLPRLIFPLGEWIKEDVKAYVSEIETLASFASQEESSEICFVDKSYEEVLKRHMSIDRPGEVVDTEGNVVGEHKGYMRYTIGKRRGFTVYGAHEPHYVLALDAKRNRLVVGTKEALLTHTFKIGKVNFFEPFTSRRCSVKVRYRSKSIPCTVRIDRDGRGSVELEEGVYGVAKGQAAAFYDNDRLIAGAIIR